jgi:hypothetical protein
MNWTRLRPFSLYYLVFQLIPSAEGQTLVGAGAKGLGGISAIQAPGTVGIFNSPAAGRWDSSHTVLCDYRNLFGVNGLGSASIGYSTGIRSLRMGLLWNRTGSAYFQRQEFRLQVAGRLSELLTLGLGLHYRRVSMSGQYSSKGLPVIQLGMGLKAGRKTDVVIDWYNAIPMKLNDAVAQADISQFRAGIRHRVSAQAGLLAEVHARYGDYPNKTILRGGLWYQTGSITFLAGAGNGPEPLSFGMSMNRKKLRLDFASAYHPSLGFSPHFSANWIW